MKKTSVKTSTNRIQELDGLRGIAIILVILYHLRGSPIRGGLLGVDLFLVLSGYLVTAGLLGTPIDRSSILTFYKRRAQKILPSLVVVVVVVAFCASLLSDAQISAVRLDAIAALLMGANWRFVITGTNYFNTIGGPSPLQHLWSLSLEEQFYLLWPLTILITPRKFIKTFVLLSVFVSALTMSILAHKLGTSRAYFGTDTRFFTLGIGALLAFRLQNLDPIQAHVINRIRRGIPCLLAVFLAIAIFVNPMRIEMYNGGFLLVATLAAAIIFSALVNVDQSSITLHVLRSNILTWFGERSYSLYLIHWPVFVLSNARLHSMPNIQLLPLQLVATVTISELLFRVVETRTGHSTSSFNVSWRSIATLQFMSLAVVGTLAIQSPELPTFLQGGSHTKLSRQSSPNNIRILVIGDSLVESLAPNLDIVSQERGITVDHISISGCGLLPGMTIGEDGARYLPSENCEKRVSDQFAQLESSQRKYSFLVWIDAWDTEDREVSNSQFRQVTDHKEFEQLLLRTLNRLSKFADRVGLVTIPPRAKSSSTNPEGPSNYAAKRMAAAEQTFRNAAMKDKNTFIIDLSRFVCPSGHPCDDTSSTGERFRPTDGVHYDGPAGRGVSDWLINQVMDFRAR